MIPDFVARGSHVTLKGIARVVHVCPSTDEPEQTLFVTQLELKPAQQSHKTESGKGQSG